VDDRVWRTRGRDLARQVGPRRPDIPKGEWELEEVFFLCAPAFHELWYHAASVDRLGFPKAALLIVGVRAPYHMCLIVPQVYCLVVRVI